MIYQGLYQRAHYAIMEIIYGEYSADTVTIGLSAQAGIARVSSSSHETTDLSKRATAIFLLSGVGWAYLIVVVIVECPNSSFTTGRLTPRSTSLVANV